MLPDYYAEPDIDTHFSLILRTPSISRFCYYKQANGRMNPYPSHPLARGQYRICALVVLAGEQNANCGGPFQPDYYACGLPALIADWRARLGQPSLPFGVCLLAAWTQLADPSFPRLRLLQVNASITLRGVFTVNTLDRGDPATGAVHSPYKQDVGARAALGVRAVALGDGAVHYRGPRALPPTSQHVPEAHLIITQIPFEPASLYGGGLVLNASAVCPPAIAPTSCESFAVLTNDCVWRSVERPGGGTLAASVAGDAPGSLTLTLSQVAGIDGLSVVGVRGYFANWPLVHLANEDGIPAEPWLLYINASSCGDPPIVMAGGAGVGEGMGATTAGEVWALGVGHDGEYVRAATGARV